MVFKRAGLAAKLLRLLALISGNDRSKTKGWVALGVPN